MNLDNDVRPSSATAEVMYLGDMNLVHPEFNEANWSHVATIKAERTMGDFRSQPGSPEWWYSTEITREIDPAIEGFWQWGDVLVRVIPATMLESGLYVFRRKEPANG